MFAIPPASSADLAVRSSLPGPINYEAERLNVRLGVIDSPARTAGHSFVSFFFASKRSPPRIFFVTRRAIYFHVSTGSPGCDSWCREHARNARSWNYCMRAGEVSLKFRSWGPLIQDRLLSKVRIGIEWLAPKSSVRIFSREFDIRGKCRGE